MVRRDIGVQCGIRRGKRRHPAMKSKRLVSLVVLLLCVTVMSFMVIMVRVVPARVDAWTRAGEPITPARALVIRASHLCRAGIVVLLPGFMAMGVASGVWYVVSARNDGKSAVDGESHSAIR